MEIDSFYMKFTLTITSSKRFSLFDKTIKSFVENCNDYNLINEIYHYDDCSSYEDRIKMSNLIHSFFPNAKLINFYFDENSFVDKKRHARIMSIWKDNLKYSNNEFVFHLEDDWEFIRKFDLTESLQVFEKNEVGYVGYTQQLRKLPDEYSTELLGDYWKWVYDEKKPIQENLFLDTTEMESHPNPNYWCYFVNWPHFSLRPGIHRITHLKKMENFSIEENHFEVEFALRYSKNYVSFNHINKIVNHLGWDISAYDLNNSNR